MMLFLYMMVSLEIFTGNSLQLEQKNINTKNTLDSIIDADQQNGNPVKQKT